MKKILVLFFTSLITLTSCGFRSKTSKENFIKEAEKTTEHKYKFAVATCVGEVESINKKDDSTDKESIDRDIYYELWNGRWRTSSDNERLTTFDTEISKTCLDLLELNVRKVIKKEPINKDDEAGLTFYVNPLTFTYKVRYEDATIVLGEVSGTKIKGKVNGDETTTYEFDDDYGYLTKYKTTSDLTVTSSYGGASLNVETISKMNIKIKYYDENKKR